MAEEVKESTKEKSSVGRMLQIGGAVVGTLVGSGFASGQEVMQYFTAYGILAGRCAYHGAVRTCAPPLRITAGSSRNRSTSPHSAITAASISARSWIFLGAVLLPCRYCHDLWFGVRCSSSTSAFLRLPVLRLWRLSPWVAHGLAWKKLTKVLGSTAPICIVFLVGVSLVTAAMNWANLANADAMVAAADASGNVLRAVDFAVLGGSSLS